MQEGGTLMEEHNQKSVFLQEISEKLDLSEVTPLTHLNVLLKISHCRKHSINYFIHVFPILY